MGAGYESTAAFVTWTLYLLLKYPEYLLLFKNSERFSIERKRIMQETLRLYPSFPVSSRQNIAPIEVGGVSWPAKTNWLISPYIVQRDPRFWENPDSFFPERFANLSADQLKFTFIPFMAGHKKCIGEQLAYQEVEIILETILNNLNLELLSLELNPICDILLYSDIPLRCNVV